MRRFRFLSFFLIVTGLGALMYLLVSLFLPSPRRLIFGVDKRTGKVRLVEQNITFLPPHQFYRLAFDRRDGSAQRDGMVRITSKEGVPVRLFYRLRFGVEKDRLPDARRLVREGWSAWIRARVSEAVSALTSQVAVEDLASPSSQFNSQRDQLRSTVTNHLARSGLKVTAFEIERIEIEPSELLRYKRAELRRNARGAVGRVALFSLEGADWELLSELIIDGRMPNLEALIERGASASVQTIQPTIAPILAATVATGLSPDRHGVVDFFDPENQNMPITSRSRRAPAVWDIAAAFGRPAGVISWWGAWPPTSGDVFIFDTPIELTSSAVFPDTWAPKVASLAVPEATVGYQQIRRFLNITPAEFQSAVNSGSSNPTVILRRSLAKTWTDHRVGIDYYREAKPMLLMISFEGTDQVNHLFGPYHPPYREGTPSEEYRKYWPTVANYYSEIDRLLGEWMRVLLPDTNVMVVSTHGMRWGKDRPRTRPEGNALNAHRNPGVFVGFGNNIVPNRQRKSMSIYDITPNILTLLGLPTSKEMPGTVSTWALRNVQPVESVNISSYSEIISEPPIRNASMDVPSFRSTLQQTGHLIDATRPMEPLLEEEDRPDDSPDRRQVPPEVWGRYAYFNNLGVSLKRQNKTREAVEALEQAIELNPNRPTPYLNLSILLFDLQKFTAAEEVFLKALVRGLPNGEKYLVDFSALFLESNMVKRAINLLQKGRELFPQSYLVAVNLGAALASADRYTEALPELERALGLRPTSTLALNNLGLIYAKKKDYARALDYWNRSLSIDPRQPKIRQGADAARTWL